MMNTAAEPQTDPTAPASTTIIIRWLIRESIGVALVGVILFLSAGTMNWMMGWILVAVTFVWVCANAFILVPRRSPLIAERLGPRKGAKTWDGVIMGIIGAATVGRLVVAGLDLRYGWSTGIPIAAQWIAVPVAVVGYGLVVWAMAINNYFSQFVRIQEERGHQVISGGPYGFVRHPGYLGSILFELSVPVLLASWWALAVAAVIVLLFILRTALEDRTLQAELEGYSEYSRRVHSRILPGIW
jgi:protein-S-isoprenylcysteine O-methyltransferase Ste14